MIQIHGFKSFNNLTGIKHFVISGIRN